VTDEYEVFALRYGTRASTKSKEFLRYSVYGEPDAPQQMDYYFWLIRNSRRTVLVDCGFDQERGAAKGRYQQVDPFGLLAAMGVRPGAVDHIVISHMHYDHIGNLEAFPQATVTVAQAEYDFWGGPLGQRAVLQSMVLPYELEVVRALEREGRLSFVDDTAELFSGVTVTRLPGHTPGQLITRVRTGSGDVVLASDAMHYYEEMERDRPFQLFEGLADTFRAYQSLRELAAEPRTAVFAGHDPRDTATHVSVLPNCIDLTQPISPSPR
jgi:glyoxylase-like metal-dependent hydrolase (beta-lactamase superfamily II)